ncbi:MAG TPA: prephenate dehydrogenase/arogenate dehydrogenase family protein [Gammaproteobacteria bacterium]|nr:prephenate dehydrogenase/arogenate dehydrogenase family protein [Gammaproteobacteria bacterium]
MINKLVIIGVGLIGGSLARALKKAEACKEIIGSNRTVAQLKKAVELGVIDRYDTDIAKAVAGADMIVLAVPVGSTEAILHQLNGHLDAKTVITDVGSTKQSVIEAARAVFGKVPDNFVPGHPIAGTEQSGVEASSAQMFQKRRVVLTPLPETDARALNKVRMMWEQAGAEVAEMDARTHDEILAATSHLPHVLAYTLVDTLACMEQHADIFRFAAGGFRDFTRIAASDPVMWRDICLANREAILKMIEKFGADLNRFGAALRDKDSAALLALLSSAKAARDGLNNS